MTMRRMGWALLVGLLVSGRAEASYVTFAFLGDTISGSGALNVTANGDGTYTAISGTLQVTGDPKAGSGTLQFNPNGTKVAYDPTTNFNYDNQLLLASTTKLNFNGLLFDSGNYRLFLYYNTTISTPDYEYEDYNPRAGYTLIDRNLQFLVGAVQPGTAPIAPAAVPEPSSLALCGVAGLAGLGVARVRRRRPAPCQA